MGDGVRGRAKSAARGDSLDPFLAALEYLARHHQKEFSAAAVTDGIPLEDGQLTPGTFPRAAERLGLVCKVVERRPSMVPAIVCPFAVLMKSGDVVIVESKRYSGRLQVFTPGVSRRSTTVSAGRLDRDATSTVFYVTDAGVQAERGEFGASGEFGSPQRGHWLWATAGRYWYSWLHVILGTLFLNLLGLALPIFVMNVYDRVIPNNSVNTLYALAAGVGIALAFDFVLRMLRAAIIDQSGRRIDMTASARLFEQALDARMAGRPARSGELANQIREFESVREFFTSATIASAIDLLFIGIFLAVLWLVVGPLAFVPLLAIPVVLVVTLLIQLPLGAAIARTLATTSNRQSVLVEALVGIETVKSIGAEGALQKKWENAVAGSVRSNSQTRFWSSVAMFFSMFVQQAVSVIMIVWGVFLIAAGDITVGALIASNMLAGRVIAPLAGIAMTISRAQQSIASLRQLNSLMRLERDHADTTRGITRNAGSVRQGAIEFRNAVFSYPGQGSKAIAGISLRIAPGERVGIIGRVGSGKSTIGKLLCGLYECDEGAILIDGIDSRHYRISELRRAVAYLGQESQLFSGTLKENILLPSMNADGDFELSARIAGVSAIAAAHPLGFGMPVGERGSGLSGGQRQAVALARLMMRPSRILFLDEPTSAMDNSSEAAFIAGFRQWVADDVTLIVATHRVSMLELVDRIIVMDAGRVIADGPKKEVLERLSKGRQISPAPAPAPVQARAPALPAQAARRAAKGQGN
jgi:ATP-binding cassette, subfamily C, bacterial LapB